VGDHRVVCKEAEILYENYDKKSMRERNNKGAVRLSNGPREERVDQNLVSVADGKILVANRFSSRPTLYR
jgi:hypothetical protein